MSYRELRDKVADMPSYIIDDDFIMYHRYLPFYDEHDQIFDVGTGWGKSVTAMALMNPTAMIYSIDDGSYPIYQKWAEDRTDYRKKLHKEFEKHGVTNIQLFVNDAITLSKNLLDSYPLIHFDLTADKEIEVLTAWLPLVAINGIVLIRNFERMKDKLGNLLDNFEYLDQGGLIYVYRRIK